ncbi:hypothetical protein HZR84_01645 [Hyphobacterium sp. CCMP332]|nr:hypothetical protein HZR84_01645 [Hyphobacterium sp. CCMP332]
MDIQSSKLELVKLILEIDNQSVLNKILDALKSNEKDFFLELSPQEKNEIEIGLNQLNSGKRISLEDYMKKFHKA